MRIVQVALIGLLLAGCLSHSEEQAMIGSRDLEDVRVFLKATGLDFDNFQASKSLQSQYDRWRDGKSEINATAANANREADSAQAMATVSLVNSMSVRSGK